MTQCKELASKAEDDLRTTIETIDRLCSERIRNKMSVSKYRRFILELKDLSKLLAAYNKSYVDNPDPVRKRGEF